MWLFYTYFQLTQNLGVTDISPPAPAVRPAAALSGSPIDYRPDIDGLRAISIIVVVLFHAGLAHIRGGYVGVDVFFVISGYLIGAMLMKEITSGTFTFSRFYARRAKRILPPLFTVLAVSSVVAILFFSPKELERFAAYCATAILSVSNVVFCHAADYFAANTELNPLLMTWSLAVEEQFYIFFPILLIAIRNRSSIEQIAAISSIVLASFALSVWATNTHPILAFYLIPARAWELGAGVLLFMFEQRQRSSRRQIVTNILSCVGVSLICFAVFFYNRNTRFPGLTALPPVLGAVLLIYSRGGWMNRVLASRPIVGIGLVSYSWYLWHWPMLSFARSFADKEISILVALLLCSLALILALLTYNYIEKPFRGSKTLPSPLLRRYAGIAAIFVLYNVIVFAAHGLPIRFDERVARLETDVSELATDKCLALYGNSELFNNAKCHWAPESLRTVAVYGDSHAAAVAPALRAKAQAADAGFLQVTKSSCPPLVGVSRYMPNHPAHFRECLKFNEDALEYLNADDRIETVVLAAFWSVPFSEGSYQKLGEEGHPITMQENKDNFITGLRHTIAALRSGGKNVIVLNDVPLLPEDPVRAELAQLIPGRRALGELFSGATINPRYGVNRREATADDEFVDNAILAQTSGLDGVSAFNLKDALCNSSTCQIADGDKILYVDRQHLSTAGAIKATTNWPWPVREIHAAKSLKLE